MFCSQCGTEIADNGQFCGKCGSRVGTANPGASAAPPRTQSAARAQASADIYGHFLRRFVAWLLDFVILTLLIGLIGAATASSAAPASRPLLIYLLVVWLYRSLLESSPWQATVGKKLLSIKVTDLNGERLSFMHATGRTVARLINLVTFSVGYLVAAFTRRRQALHDMIAGTLVLKAEATPEEVKANPEAPASDGGTAIAIVVVSAFAMIFVIGILAAIAIPAYQNYTIRAQVAHGLSLVHEHQSAVSQALARGATLESINSSADNPLVPGLAGGGTYEDSIQVVGGGVLITFGRTANARIAGKKLLIYPVKTSDGALVWVCGSANPPANVNLASVSLVQSVTDVGAQYLPSHCRGTS